MDRLIASQVFVGVATRGSMSATARALDMSRPMVTRYLAEMERWTGARLLHRSTRRLSLTPAGEETLARCQRMLDVAAEMTAVCPEGDNAPRGLLRMACSQSLAQEVVAPAVAQYLRLYPNVSVDLQIASHSVNLVEKRVDLAIRITNDIDPNLIARPLAECASVICASPEWVQANGLLRRVEELSQHNCLTYSHFGKSLWEFTRDGEPVSVPVGGNLSANEPQVLLAATLEGAGVSMQPLYAVDRLLLHGRLVRLLPDYEPRLMGVHGIFASRRQMNPALRTMIDFLADWFKDAQHWAKPSARGASKKARVAKTRKARD